MRKKKKKGEEVSKSNGLGRMKEALKKKILLAFS